MRKVYVQRSRNCFPQWNDQRTYWYSWYVSTSYPIYYVRGRLISQTLYSVPVIAEHHLSLSQSDSQDYIGVVNTRLSPPALLRSVGEYAQELCEVNYGSAPDFYLTGNTDTVVAYIGVHLEYIFMELLKNAMRATVEFSQVTGRLEHPPIEITVSKGQEDVVVRIRDQGGGISKQGGWACDLLEAMCDRFLNWL